MAHTTFMMQTTSSFDLLDLSVDLSVQCYTYSLFAFELWDFRPNDAPMDAKMPYDSHSGQSSAQPSLACYAFGFSAIMAIDWAQ